MKTKVKTIKVGPSLKRRSRPTYGKSLILGFLNEVMTGVFYGCIPIIMNEVNELKQDFEKYKEKFQEKTFEEEGEI